MAETYEKYKGVKGWLLLLCLSLTVLDPSAILLNLFYVTNAAKPYFESNPAFFRLILITGIFRIALMVFSIYAGISLWRMVPGAPAVAVMYFRAVVFYAVLVMFLPRLVGISEEMYRDMAGANALNSLITVAYVTVWYLYLRRSRRVKATYGEDTGGENK